MKNSNTIRWSSIELTVREMFQGYNVPRSELNAALFETACVATAKFDGTNVGKDERGVMYGRNLVIEPGAVSCSDLSIMSTSIPSGTRCGWAGSSGT